MILLQENSNFFLKKANGRLSEVHLFEMHRFDKSQFLFMVAELSKSSKFGIPYKLYSFFLNSRNFFLLFVKQGWGMAIYSNFQINGASEESFKKKMTTFIVVKMATKL